MKLLTPLLLAISLLSVGVTADTTTPDEPFAFWQTDEPFAFWQTVGSIIEEHDHVIDSAAALEFGDKTQLALNSLVDYSARSLEFYGFKDDAAQIRREWTERFYSHFTGIGILDLGDHAALSQWLTDLYKKLRLRFGDSLVARLHLDDINIINYAIPVVFMPLGNKKTGDSWDKLEYSKHFVPFASVVTYWTSYGVCYYLTRKQAQIRKYCKNISSLLRTGMRNWVAPKLSDWVYDTAHKNARGDLDISRLKIRAKYEAEIRSWGIAP